MNISKSLWVVLAGGSLCMANISGIVTDTGTTPISGAVVQLVNGGQTTTTEADGRFTLVIGSATLPVNGKLFANGLSARITGNLMTVTIGERSVVEVATFDLTGKAISKVRQIMDAGNHSIVLPQRGAGIYLYKVKSGNREFVLKGNSVGGVVRGTPLSLQSPSGQAMAKTAVINDVIAATKTGYLNYRCVQYNSNTTGIVIKMIASAGTVTDADGNVYTTVKIGTQEWTVENLRVTKYNDGSSITKITDKAAWYDIYVSNLTTSAYCFYNNTTNADSIKKFGALYNWYTVNTKKLAPAGWHVPTDAEWTVMENYLVLNGYNWDGTKDTSLYNKIAKSLAAKTDWYTNTSTGVIGNDLTKNNSSGFSALPGGYRNSDGNFGIQGHGGYWWSATENDASNAWDRVLYYYDDNLYRYGYNKSCGFSVRLVKD